MKSRYLVISIILIVAIGIYFFVNNRNAKREASAPVVLAEKQQTSPNTSVKSDSDPVAWKDYTNERLGIYFQYPSTWLKQKMDLEAINLSGKTTAVEINFIDTVKKTSFLLTYHFPPNGLVLYKQVEADYNNSKGWFKGSGEKKSVADKVAYKGKTILKEDGKGRPLNPQIRLVTVYFLDTTQTGEYEMQLKAPIPASENAEMQLEHLLSSFKFIEKK